MTIICFYTVKTVAIIVKPIYGRSNWLSLFTKSITVCPKSGNLCIDFKKNNAARKQFTWRQVLTNKQLHINNQTRVVHAAHTKDYRPKISNQTSTDWKTNKIATKDWQPNKQRSTTKPNSNKRSTTKPNSNQILTTKQAMINKQQHTDQLPVKDFSLLIKSRILKIDKWKIKISLFVL